MWTHCTKAYPWVFSWFAWFTRLTLYEKTKYYLDRIYKTIYNTSSFELANMPLVNIVRA